MAYGDLCKLGHKLCSNPNTNKQTNMMKRNQIWSKTIESAIPFPVPEICNYWRLSPFSSLDNHWHFIPVLPPDYVLTSSPSPSQENGVKGFHPLFTPGDNLSICPCPLPWYICQISDWITELPNIWFLRQPNCIPLYLTTILYNTAVECIPNKNIMHTAPSTVCKFKLANENVIQMLYKIHS